MLFENTHFTKADGEVSGSHPARGYLQDWPVEGWVSGWYRDPNRPNHGGIDIAAKEGTPIYAPAEGFIYHLPYAASFGYWSMVKHETGDGENVWTAYAHMPEDGQIGRSGSHVVAGQRIGTVGSTGNSTGNHLHWAMSSQSRFPLDHSVLINPRDYVGSPIVEPPIVEPGDPVELTRAQLEMIIADFTKSRFGGVQFLYDNGVSLYGFLRDLNDATHAIKDDLEILSDRFDEHVKKS